MRNVKAKLTIKSLVGIFTLAAALPSLAVKNWPAGLGSPNAAYECASETHRAQKSLVVWVDEAKQVIALASYKEKLPLPAFAVTAVDQKIKGSKFAIKTAKKGLVLQEMPGDAFQLKIGGESLVCSIFFEDR